MPYEIVENGKTHGVNRMEWREMRMESTDGGTDSNGMPTPLLPAVLPDILGIWTATGAGRCWSRSRRSSREWVPFDCSSEFGIQCWAFEDVGEFFLALAELGTSWKRKREGEAGDSASRCAFQFSGSPEALKSK